MKCSSSEMSVLNEMKQKKTDVTEVKISVPWGHVAGKWWGTSDVRPILLIHGWLDNAGSFDTLIPLLPKDNISYLAVDLPGHGFSSHIPEGMTYSHFDYVWLIHRIKTIYEWDKVSLIGHSMGGMLCFLYAGIFSRDVDMIITLDGIKPITTPEFINDMIKHSITKTTTEISHHMSPKSQPAYTKDELIEKMQASSYDSLGPRDCEYIFIRGIKKSPIRPERFFLRIDGRVKLLYMIFCSEGNSHDLAREIICPLLQITVNEKMNWERGEKDKTSVSQSQISEQRKTDDFVASLEKNNPHVKQFMVSGKHHVHLSHPERVSGTISDFILKYRMPKSKI